MPDVPEAAIPANGLAASLNLLPAMVGEQATALETRPGFLASSFGLINPAGFNTTGYYAHQLFYFEAIFGSAREKYLIAILSSGLDDTASNILFCVLDLSNVGGGWGVPTGGNLRVPHAGYEHWGGSASSKWYGGTGGEPMYEWDPGTGAFPHTFTADIAAINAKTWVDDADAGVDTTTETARDYAFKKEERVKIGTQRYASSRSIRYTKWNDDVDTGYAVGDRVSRYAEWAAGPSVSYWKSFECIKAHIPNDVGNDAPGTGTDTKTYWKKVRLGPPLDDDNEVTSDWFVLAEPSQTIIGRFHGYRLWLRRHDSDNWSWAQYSAPFKPEKNEVIADLVFDPTDWTPSNDIDGNGGGWENFRSGDGGDGDAIRAFYDLGSYFMVFKRWGSHVIAGTDESTWTIRDLDPQRGTVWARSVCAHDGLVYFLTLDGTLCLTDGTQVVPAKGADKVKDYINGRLDTMLALDDTLNILPTLTSFNGLIYLTLSDPDGTDDVTLAYEPTAGSWWPTDLPAMDIAVGRIDGVETMWFTGTTVPADAQKPGIFQLTPGFYEDGDKATFNDANVTDTAWSFRTAWFYFGLARADRRIRRTWALIQSAAAITLSGYRNYHSSAAYSTAPTQYSDTPHLEGKAMHDARAVGLGASGTQFAEVYGVAFDTEHRRTRYHTGGSV